MLLKTKQLSKSFGGLKAMNKVDFELPKNEIRGIIGPNGSGKSTFFNLVSGIYDSDPGSYIELMVMILLLLLHMRLLVMVYQERSNYLDFIKI